MFKCVERTTATERMEERKTKNGQSRFVFVWAHNFITVRPSSEELRVEAKDMGNRQQHLLFAMSAGVYFSCRARGALDGSAQ